MNQSKSSIEFKKNKILFVVNSINFLISHRYELCESLINDGYQVLIVCGNEKLKDSYTEKAKNLNFHQLNFNRLEKNPLSILMSILKLIKIISIFNPSKIHTVSPIGNLIGGLASVFYKKIFLITAISGRGTLYINQKFSTKIMKLVFLFCEYLYLNKKKSITITQNTNDYKDIKKRQFSKKVNKIIKGSGVDLSLFYPLDSKKIYDFCYIGRLTEDKGAIDFIRAAEMAHKVNKNLKFIMLGEMPFENKKLFAYFKKEFAEKSFIKYMGFKTNLLEIYNSTRYLCLPSKREGMPRVVLEASACGVPSIVYNVIGCNEAVENDVNGFILEKVCIKLLFKKMIEVSEKKDMSDMRLNSRLHSEKHFSIEKVIQAHKEIYKIN